jgi:hypothetical protein
MLFGPVPGRFPRSTTYDEAIRKLVNYEDDSDNSDIAFML